MAKLPDEFLEASSNLEPEEDAENAKHAHSEVRDVLEADPYLEELKVDSLLIGSYGRQVSIKRVKDVDVFTMLPEAPEDLKGSDILRRVESVLGLEYGASRVERQDHSVKVDFPDFDLAVDVVPAKPSTGGHWEIPDPTEGWIETDPLMLGDFTTAMNKLHTVAGAGVYVPTVKYVRQIRRASSIVRPSGLYIEILTYWAFDSGNVVGSSRAEYLVTTLREAANQLDAAINAGGLPDPTLPGQVIATKATPQQLQNALDKLRDAAELAAKGLAEEDPCGSAVLWRQLFRKDTEGNWVFPIPPGCAEDGSRKSHVVPGEKRAPQGRDRFA